MIQLFLSAALLILSYPPFDFGWVAWVALVPWLCAIQAAAPRQAFLRSALVGLLFFGGTMGWLVHVTIPGTILLIPYLALYFGVWGWLARRLTVPSGTGLSLRLLFGLPAAWVVLEYLRGHLLTGLGWNLLAHTQWNWISLIQIADLTGVYGVSFLVVLVNVAVWEWVRRRHFEAKPRNLTRSVISNEVRDLEISRHFVARDDIIAGGFLLLALVYGNVRLQQIGAADAGSSSFKVSIVQGNIPQPQKWDDAFAEAIWKRYESLIQEAAKAKPDLILWPETSVPGFLDDALVADRLRKIAQESRTPFLAGVPLIRTAPDHLSGRQIEREYNSAALIGSDGTVLERYDKVHLVPFGEYLPLQPVLGWLRNFVLMGEFSPGNRYTVFRSGVPPFSVLICFEDLFPGLSRRFVREGAEWLVVITNDAWFKHSAASLQHLQASVFRAVENRVWVVRAANTGWSGFVDPCGRRLPPPSQAPRFKPGVAAAELAVPAAAMSRPTFYGRWGDWFIWLCLLFLGWAFLPSRKGYNKEL
ncbi:MAG: apolipoprotein N-acyltransferase [Candidatus Omnitrophica bacterium]|nr:apolipoprotein N-acyltransferase [Candidatus Omnitrophota bacterium]